MRDSIWEYDSDMVSWCMYHIPKMQYDINARANNCADSVTVVQIENMALLELQDKRCCQFISSVQWVDKPDSTFLKFVCGRPPGPHLTVRPPETVESYAEHPHNL